jgi:hypothetical protein
MHYRHFLSVGQRLKAFKAVLHLHTAAEARKISNATFTSTLLTCCINTSHVYAAEKTVSAANCLQQKPMQAVSCKLLPQAAGVCLHG